MAARAATDVRLCACEHWAVQRFGADCKMAGGRFTYITGDAKRSYRCEPAPTNPSNTSLNQGLAPTPRPLLFGPAVWWYN
ncbi:hypothetical protein J2X36_004295 [Methylobacterium sp. BE186]|nr:hypothetical protein [Methylobacterium sp. BE186]